MIKCSHVSLVIFSGLVWLAIGFFLLPLGLNFIVDSILKDNASSSHPLLNFFSPVVGGYESAALLLIAIGLAIGFLKGRFIFSKTVQRSVNRITSLPNPVSLFKIYPLSYYLLIGSMVFLGILVKFLPNDVRGCVDVIIGAALINGSVLYFRQAWALRKEA